eukprot:gene46169-37669_t
MQDSYARAHGVNLLAANGNELGRERSGQRELPPWGNELGLGSSGSGIWPADLSADAPQHYTTVPPAAEHPAGGAVPAVGLGGATRFRAAPGRMGEQVMSMYLLHCATPAVRPRSVLSLDTARDGMRRPKQHTAEDERPSCPHDSYPCSTAVADDGPAALRGGGSAFI